MADMKLCKHCKTEIPKKAKVCPHCRKSQRNIIIRIIGWFFAICFIFVLICAMFPDEKEYQVELKVDDIKVDGKSVKKEAQKKSKSKKEKAKSNDIIDVDIDDCHVKYKKHEVVENLSGEKCVAIYYTFKNNSDEKKAFTYTIGDKCFQDGIELESSWFHVSDESHDSDAEIKPGKKITVCSAFVLRDEETDVELEIGPLFSWSDDPDDEMVLSIK